MSRAWLLLVRWLTLLVLCLLALQLFFVLRIALMVWVDPQSTTFQRSDALRIMGETGDLPWRQQWVDAQHISDHLKRAVIASEDGGFVEHNGVDWDAIEKAWERNANPSSSDALLALFARHSVRPSEGGGWTRKHDPYFLRRWPFRRDDRWSELRSLRLPLVLING